MKILFLILVVSSNIFADDKSKFKKLERPMDASVCDTKQFADCLAYKYILFYYPKLREPEWFKNILIQDYFSYRVAFKNPDEKGEILVSFQNYADGLEWNYWEDSTITAKTDPLKLISPVEVSIKVKQTLESLIGKKYELETVTKILNRKQRQSQPSPKEYLQVKEETKYKIRVNGQVIVFKGNGEQVD